MTGRTAVYRLYDANDTLLYVGVATAPDARLKAHSKHKSWWGDVARTSLDWYPDRETALAAETAAIRSERPKYNVRHAETDAMTEARQMLERWTRNFRQRDPLVRAAYDAGVPKYEIHVLSGIARTTLDRILSPQE